MTLEDKLRDLIKEEFGSISALARQIKMPPTTLESILQRGIPNANITNVIKVCDALGISTDSLANGKIEKKLTQIDIEKLTPQNKEKLTEYFELLVNSQGD